MSDSLQPWIAQYLVDVAETYGGDLVALKWSEKSQKGQVIRFLTEPRNGALLWGMLSDGEYSVPVKIAREAAAEDQELHDEALRPNCIISVQKYKVISTRVPHGNGPGLCDDSRLVIECAAFIRSRRAIDRILGTPKGLADHEGLKIWTEGLNRGGGAGNVLKQRRQTETTKAPALPPTPIVAEEKKPVQLQTSRARPPPEAMVPIKPVLVDATLPWNEYFQQLEASMFTDLSHLVKPPVRSKAPASMPMRQKSVARASPKVVPPATPRVEAPTSTLSSSPEVPVEWSPTPARARTHLPSPPSERPLSPVMARIRPSQLLLSDRDLPDPETQEQASPSQQAEEARDNTFSSSLPKPSQPTLDEDKMDFDLDPQRPISYEQPYPTEARKVPRPPTPKRLLSKGKDGPGIVLVPNSDVSMAGSSQPSQEQPRAKVIRKALSKRDINSQSQVSVPGQNDLKKKSRLQPSPSRGTKRPSTQLSQEENYDGDEESMEKLGLTRAGKKNRTEGGRSVQSTTQVPKAKKTIGSNYSAYPWPVVSARQVYEVLQETDRRRGRL